MPYVNKKNLTLLNENFKKKLNKMNLNFYTHFILEVDKKAKWLPICSQRHVEIFLEYLFR